MGDQRMACQVRQNFPFLVADKAMLPREPRYSYPFFNACMKYSDSADRRVAEFLVVPDQLVSLLVGKPCMWLTDGG